MPDPRPGSRTLPPGPDPGAAAERAPLVARDLRAPSDAPLVLGRYRLRRRLGTGGFATVWLAQDQRLDREVAVKILPRARVIAGDRAGAGGGRFEREARAAARLAHPGIVTLYEAAVDDEGAYLVSELVHGTTLDELLEAGRLSDRDVVRIGIALCDALSHAHAQGVIHRDVKPSNVLVPDHPTTPAGVARLTDFGVARVLDGDTLTRTGDVVGTEAYMAPEQAQGLPAGAPADLFSLALILYEALSGTNPVRTAVTRRRATHLPPLRRQRRELPRELGQAIDLALRPRPSERGSLAELRAALVASVGRAADEPGVVAAPWPTRTLTRTQAPDLEVAEEIFDEGRSRRPDRPPVSRTPSPPVAVPWPRRALAAIATAVLVAWALHHVSGIGAPATVLAAGIAAALIAVLPRAGWVVLATAAAASLIVASRPGAALALLAGAVVPMLTNPFDGLAWPVAVGAPVLGAVGLAAAWPALAGLSRRAHRRAALGATGYIWAALAGNGIASTETLPDGFHHVLAPLATVGTPITAGIWALAALTLPWTRSRRWPALECLRLALWATGLALATLAAENTAGAVHTRSVLLGAVVGALVAHVTRRASAALRRARSGNDRPPLA
ncbi:MAG TPA: serine/threonine-protein kinase [Solirubrobacteraceae bacterium]|nr:serine/threonine-protein kinase [Solirubrobacteraceae bacterium]